MRKTKLDEVGYWSEVKLDIVREYATAYSTIMARQEMIRKHVYIDAFAGAGVHMSKQTRKFIPGSPLNALNVEPPFSELHFVDLDESRIESLRRIAGKRPDVTVHHGDCNEILLKHIFPRCGYEDYHRALCLLDPYKLNVDWRVLQVAGEMRSVEIFYNFMLMDANMNVLWRQPDSVSPRQIARMDAVWGDRSWQKVAYETTPGLFGDIVEKASNEAVAQAFRRRLKDVAGFEFVPDPMPMRNSAGSIIYYLFFASPNRTGQKIVRDIFEKYRSKR